MSARISFFVAVCLALWGIGFSVQAQELGPGFSKVKDYL
jgi:hypothetical protein